MEIALLDIDCLVRSDAVRVLLLVFKDGPVELGPPITTALLHLVDKPSSRQYLLPGSDLETVLVGLTEEYGKVPSKLRDRHLAKLQTCLGNIGILLASWPGELHRFERERLGLIRLSRRTVHVHGRMPSFQITS